MNALQQVFLLRNRRFRGCGHAILTGVHSFGRLLIPVICLAGGAALGTFVTRGDQLAPADSFVAKYFESNVWDDTRWLGVRVQKLPLDLWVYQEIIYETRPDVLIEAGTLRGGSAYYFASLFDLLGNGRVITIDIVAQPNLPQHPRISYLNGSSTSAEVVESVKNFIQPNEKVMVVLDSDHSRDHVYRELEAYAPMVTPGQYLVVEDTCINGHPVMKGFGPGPMEAVLAFLKERPEFVRDPSREKFMATFNPKGWLKRVR